MPGVPDLTDVARSSLLDALEALEEQKEALVLVGAQASTFASARRTRRSHPSPRTAIS